MSENTPFLQELTEIVSLLRVYRVYDENGLIPLRRLGKDYDGGYIVPEKALQVADVVMGYGIGETHDSSFEEMSSEVYQKRSYGFDGSVAMDKISHPLFHFTPIYIIGNDHMKTSGGVPTKHSSFDEHLEIFHLQDKKIFVKMDIEGNEYATLPDILRYTPQITGITFEMHFAGMGEETKALQLLKQFQKDYLLVHLHGHNFSPKFQAPNGRCSPFRSIC